MIISLQSDDNNYEKNEKQKSMTTTKIITTEEKQKVQATAGQKMLNQILTSDNSVEKQISNVFNTEEEKKKFMTSCAMTITNDSLSGTSLDSIKKALLHCITYKLYPNNISGEAFILKYGEEAKFQLGYQGIITLLKRSGMKVITAIVYQNELDEERFSYNIGDNEFLKHEPIVFGDRGKAVGVYAIIKDIKTNDTLSIKVMSEADVLKIKALSKSAQGKFSAWDKDPELYMWRKTAIKQAVKSVSKEEIPKVQEAIEIDNQDSIISDNVADTLAQKIEQNTLQMGKKLEATMVTENKE